MTHDRTPRSHTPESRTPEKIVCAGTLASITCYPVRSLVLDGYGEQASSQALLGNDAVIVSRLLHASGTAATCLLIDPTVGDVEALDAAEPDLAVRAPARPRAGQVTRSAVLQADDGRRYWLLPPPPPTQLTTRPQLPDPSAAAGSLLYADLYDELEDLLIPWLTAGRNRLAGIVVNLSGSRHRLKAARLAPLSPLLVQASLPRAMTADSLETAARKLRALTGARHVIVSAGPSGFALHSPDGLHARRPAAQVNRVALGAGAALSAGAMRGLLIGLDGAALADEAATAVASYLATEVP